MQYFIADWVVKPEENLISHVKTNQVHKLEPQTMKVLVLLIKNQHLVVMREQFLQEVWKDRVVVEEGLTRCISELRKIFGDNPRSPSLIKTVHKRGYKLLTKVTTHKDISIDSNLPKKRFEMLQGYPVLFVLAAVIILIAGGYSFWSTETRPVQNNKKQYVNLNQLKSQLNLPLGDSKEFIWIHPIYRVEYTINADFFIDKYSQQHFIAYRVTDNNNAEKWRLERPYNNDQEQSAAVDDFMRGINLIQKMQADPTLLSLPEALQKTYQKARYRVDKRGKEDLEIAIKLFDEVLSEQPDFVHALIDKAVAVRSMGFHLISKEDKAKQMALYNLLIDQAKISAPDNPMVISVTASFDAQKMNWSEYEHNLIRGINYAPACVICVRQLVDFYVNVGYYDKAIVLLNEHLIYSPLSTLTHTYLGELYTRSADIEEATQQALTIEALGAVDSTDGIAAKLNLYGQIGDVVNYRKTFDYFLSIQPLASNHHAAMVAQLNDDLAKFQEIDRNMERRDFNLALSAGDFDFVVQRIKRNVSSGSLRDLGLVHGWLFGTNEINRYYQKNLLALKNHPEIVALFKEIGLFSFWTENGKWPDYCHYDMYINQRPDFCPQKNLSANSL